MQNVDSAKTQAALTDFFRKDQNQHKRLKLVEENGSCYLQCETWNKPTGVQTLFSSQGLTLKEIAQFCASNQIPHWDLEKAIREHNSSYKFWTKIPASVRLKLQCVRLATSLPAEQAKFFLEKKDNWRTNSNEVNSYCAHATTHNCDQVLKALLRDNELSQDEKDQLLRTACQCSAAASAKVLLEAFANVNACDQKGWPSIMYAVESNNLELCELLLKHQANVDLGPFHFSPLMLAAQKGNPFIVKLLIKHGANLLLQNDTDQMNALTWASVNGHVEIMKELLKKKAKQQLAIAKSRGFSIVQAK